MENWRRVLREKVLPNFINEEVEALYTGVNTRDPTLLRGTTTQPIPLNCVRNLECEGACLIGYAAWKGRSLHSMGEVESAFAKHCRDAGPDRAISPLIRWWDDTEPSISYPEMAYELRREIFKRGLASVFAASYVDGWLATPNKLMPFGTAAPESLLRESHFYLSFLVGIICQNTLSK